MKKLIKQMVLFGLVALNVASWSITLSDLRSQLAETTPPEPTVFDAGGCTDNSPESAFLTADRSISGSDNEAFFKLVAENNCNGVDSCGTGKCRQLHSLSEKKYPNGIDQCKRDRAGECFNVTCHIKVWLNRNCSGQPDEDYFVDRRGCARQNVYPDGGM